MVTRRDEQCPVGPALSAALTFKKTVWDTVREYFKYLLTFDCCFFLGLVLRNTDHFPSEFWKHCFKVIQLLVLLFSELKTWFFSWKYLETFTPNFWRFLVLGPDRGHLLFYFYWTYCRPFLFAYPCPFEYGKLYLFVGCVIFPLNFPNSFPSIVLNHMQGLFSNLHVFVFKFISFYIS